MIRPTCTLPSVIKKVFRPGERSLPREEITQRVEESLLAAGQDQGSEAILDEILRMEHSPIRIGRTDAIIELTYQPHQLFDMAYRFLRDTHTPKTVEQIVPELRRQTQFSWNQVERLLQLQRDPRFIQYKGDKRWFLAEWRVANDELYAFARKQGISQMSSRTIHYFMEHEAGLPAREYVFLPELDDRFSFEGEFVQFISPLENSRTEQMEAVPQEAEETQSDTYQPELTSIDGPLESTDQESHEIDQPRHTEDQEFELISNQLELHTELADNPLESKVPQAEIESVEYSITTDTMEDSWEPTDSQAIEEAAVGIYTEAQQQFTFEEETYMNTTQTPSVLTEVNQLLRQALSRLEERNHEMSQDVIGYFQKSDMQAIEILMKEKHKNEQMALGIQQVLANVERQ